MGTTADERAFSRFLADLAAPCDASAFPARAARLLGELVPCMASGYGLRDTRTGEADASVGLQEIEYQTEEKRFLVEHLHELPYIDLLGPVSPRPRDVALCSSDFYSSRQFRGLAVYSEVFGPKRIRYQMVLPTFDMAPLWVGGFGMQRDACDFSADERALFARARAHLIEAARTAALFSLAQSSKEIGTVIVDERGATIMGSSLLPLLARYCGPSSGGLPDEIRSWLARPLERASDASLVKRSNDRTLTVRRCLDPDRRLAVLLVREEHAGLTALTSREREVADWICQGLSNREVGTILGISANTVKRHISAVFLKMEIDNRTELTRALTLTSR